LDRHEDTPDEDIHLPHLRRPGPRSLHPDSVAEGERLFAALSEGGQVVMPMEKTFWAERFGMFTDRFGVSWMVNCETP